VKVAALYDEHGNLPALEAVLGGLDVDLIVVGGDVVGGAFPRETVELLRELGDRVSWLRGNAERELLEPPRLREGGPPLGESARQRQLLGEEHAGWLYALPERVELDMAGLGRVLFCHATPANDLDIVTPLTSDGRLAQILAGVEADVVVAGHTHIQDDRVVSGIRWVNAGSVGMPYEDGDGAFWTLLGDDVELRRTEYDRSGLGAYDYPQATRLEAAEYFEGLVDA
jgi:putative phosphoesterase